MTLTEAAAFTKKSVYFIGIPFLAITLVWIVYRTLVPNSDLPDNYITPDYMCGPLDTITIDSLPVSKSDTTISIETTSGAIPDLPTVVNVFEYAHPGASLSALQESQIIAQNLNFDMEAYTRPTTTEYQWTDTDTAKTLVVETGNLNFDLKTDFSNPNVELNSKTLPSSTERAIEIATTYLQSRSLLTRDYYDGYQKAYLIKLTADGQMREATSISEAQMIRVDFFRKKDLITIDPTLAQTEQIGSSIQNELEDDQTTTDQGSTDVKKYTTDILNDSPIFGNISVYIGGQMGEYNSDYQILGINYVNWYLADQPCGTYKLISPDEAVKKVQDGEAALVNLVVKNGDHIAPHENKVVTDMLILDVSLDYYDTKEKQYYLQPIYVIKGEAELDTGEFADFYYYVPAIDYDSIPEDAGIAPVEEETQNP
ncbi:hypothetical protein JW887_01620 [Candidatus Dojkabacteria bacterium]|nr:hypothetical protein [Candidatus Dojkabacteria bacterium]